MDARAGSRLLVLFGWWNLVFALLHVVIIVVGGAGYRYFGAGEGMAKAADAGELRPTVITAGLTVMFAVFGMYALSAAGRFRHLPAAKYVVAGIGVLYLLRGLLAAPQAWWAYTHPGVVPGRFVMFSCFALLMGIVCLQGVALVWKTPALRPAEITHS